MAPIAPSKSNVRAQILAPPVHNSDQSPSSRRTLSLSSSPSFSSSNSSLTSFDSNNSPISPSTPLHFSGQIPFSWEQIPGIPKTSKQISKKTNSLTSLLPLPPAAGNTVQKKHNYNTTSVSFRKDPFVAALVECSKGSNQEGNFWKSSRVTRTLSDRLGFVGMYTSCKTTCTVSESMVYLPRSSHDIYNNTTRPSR